MIPLIGYTDKLSYRPGENINFMVSSTGESSFSAQLVRIICADPNPAGQGLVEEEIDSLINKAYPSRVQKFYPGSYAFINCPINLSSRSGFVMSVLLFPTLQKAQQQTIISCKNAILFISSEGCLSVRLDNNLISLDSALLLNTWQQVSVEYDAETGKVVLSQSTINDHLSEDTTAKKAQYIGNFDLHTKGIISIAAEIINSEPVNHFNGKIEAPTVFSDYSACCVFAKWDFSVGISSTKITDVGSNELHGELINMPTRGVTGSEWDASEMCWRHAPEHYAAIHFHDDDIYDFDWQTDFTLTVPEALRSGVYAAKITCGEHVDYLPFFICPPMGKSNANLCVLVSTFTYTVYGNHARPDFGPEWHKKTEKWNAYPLNPAEHVKYGLSTYNTHVDGSGICHASYKRPLLNMRPGYLTFHYGKGSGLRHFQADSHLIAWLHAKCINYDIITDQELHDEGVTCIQEYKVVTTGSHPEYHTLQTLDALQAYRDIGGRLMYLGGNGFYWRIATHAEHVDMLEIRRGEGGIRAWASEPGEYYNAFNGTYGGLWRRSARPPQQLVGIGFSAQGQFSGSYYVVKQGSEAPPSAEWILKGINDLKLGNFGLSGGGAAGFELDRVDTRLGSPENIEVIASSKGHDQSFVLVPEEQLTHITNWPGEPEENLLRADMVYFKTPSGGEVFSTGSITFCGSLPINNFDNNISTLLENVVRRFLR